MRFRSHLVKLAIMLTLLIPTIVRGQDQPTSTGRKFDPPVTTVEITGKEPTSKAYQLQYAVGGGGGPSAAVKFFPASSTPFWTQTQAMVFAALKTVVPNSLPVFRACNYPAGNGPRVTLTDPDGKVQSLTATDETGGCYSVVIEPEVGMSLGLYTLTFDHPKGQLIYQFGFDYEPCLNVFVGAETNANFQITKLHWLIAGLTPQETFNAYFFHRDDDHTDQNNNTPTYRLADRQITADGEGAAIIEVRITRSAPFSLNEVEVALVGANGKDYNNFIRNYVRSGENQIVKDLGVVPEKNIRPQVKYSTYNILDSGVWNAPPSCDQNLGSFAQVIGNNAPLYSNYADVSTQIGTLSTGDPIQVLEQKPAILDKHVVMWTHLRTEDGKEGWSYGNQLQNIETINQVGSKLEIQQVGTADGKVIDLTLRKASQANAERVVTLKPGSQVIYVKDIEWNYPNPHWFYVQDQDGHTGYIPASILYSNGAPSYGAAEQNPDPFVETFRALPWAPVDVSKIPPPQNIVSGSGGSSAPADGTACPNGLVSRLKVGIKVHVISTDPPYLNSLPMRPSLHPDSKRIRQIPPGAIYTILDGPQCADGVTWWKVNYNGQVGWTGEGDSTGYWVEPVQ